ncbi:Uncharacterised protein [Mycobacteroides abscessus subsp. massiliense]|nr:Uncharacterised protein [Mycobacteroides abscessus subsp. massiliense]
MSAVPLPVSAPEPTAVPPFLAVAAAPMAMPPAPVAPLTSAAAPMAIEPLP